MESPQSGKSPMEAPPVIVDRAARYVLQLYNQRHDPRQVFHTYQHALATVECVAELGRDEQINGEDLEVAMLAAWFADVGYLYDHESWDTYSLREARAFLAKEEYPPERQIRVGQCLQAIDDPHPPEGPAQRLLVDASLIVNYIAGFPEKNRLRRLEGEFLRQEHYDRLEWARHELRTLLGIRLNTRTARARYEAELSGLILNQKAAIEKAERKAREQLPPPKGRPFTQIEEGTPVRGAQTFFRSNYRNHINLSSIADNKANIMISVNSVLITVLITFLSYRNIGETQPQILLPVVLFLVTGLASLIFAVLSARPKVTSLVHREMNPEEKRRNIVFFGNFVHLDLDEYEEAMDEMFNDSELLYGNLTRDLYYLGKVLDKKYRYLTISYNIFMVGFIATVSTFLLVFFT